MSLCNASIHFYRLPDTANAQPRQGLSYGPLARVGSQPRICWLWFWQSWQHWQLHLRAWATQELSGCEAPHLGSGRTVGPGAMCRVPAMKEHNYLACRTVRGLSKSQPVHQPDCQGCHREDGTYHPWLLGQFGCLGHADLLLMLGALACAMVIEHSSPLFC